MAWLYDHLECLIVSLILGGLLWVSLAHPPFCKVEVIRELRLDAPAKAT